MRKITICMLGLALCFTFTIPTMAEEISIVGTGDGVAVLKAIGEAFSRDNPDVTIDVPKSIGSGGAIKTVGADQNMIGRVARKIKDKEKPYGLTYIPFAKVPTVFVVNESVSIQNLSAQQVCDIYSGKITNWREVGGKDARIKVVRREDGDSSLGELQASFPGFKNITMTDKSKTAFSTPENFTVLEETSDTIGFGPYDVAKDANVRILKIDGKDPTDAGYPTSVTLALVYKEKNKTGNIKRFIDFLKSTSAQDAVQRSGGIPY
jgi:phosphate transport system substrate-binding protein